MASTLDRASRTPAARTAVHPTDVPRTPLPFSPAITAGGWVFVGGRTATDFRSAMSGDIDFDPRRPYRTSALGLESDYVFASLARTLAAAGADLRTDVARLYVWVAAEHPTYEEFLAGSSTSGVHIHEYARSFDAAMDEPRPASAALGIRELIAPGNRVGLELIAIPGVGRVESGIPDDLPSPITGTGCRASCLPPRRSPPCCPSWSAPGASTAGGCQMFFEDFGELASSVEEWAAHFTTDAPAANTVRLGGPLLVPGAHVLYDAIGHVPATLA